MPSGSFFEKKNFSMFALMMTLINDVALTESLFSVETLAKLPFRHLPLSFSSFSSSFFSFHLFELTAFASFHLQWHRCFPLFSSSFSFSSLDHLGLGSFALLIFQLQAHQVSSLQLLLQIHFPLLLFLILFFRVRLVSLQMSFQFHPLLKVFLPLSFLSKQSLFVLYPSWNLLIVHMPKKLFQTHRNSAMPLVCRL